MDPEESVIEVAHIGLEKGAALGIKRPRSISIWVVERLRLDSIFRKLTVGISFRLQKVP